MQATFHKTTENFMLCLTKKRENKVLSEKNKNNVKRTNLI